MSGVQPQFRPVLSHPAGIVASMAELTDTEREILAIERLLWVYPGAKEAAIRERLGISVTRYYQSLNALLDREDVLAAEPLLVRRLRRVRASRQLSRRRTSRQA